MNLDKINDENLKKSCIELEKIVLNLSKEKNIDFNVHKAKVCVCLDYSGSMSGEYSSGRVQRVLNRLVPLALKFDDNGELDVILFQNGCKELKPITLENYSDYVKKVIDKSGYSMGGTEYAPAIKKLISNYGTPKGVLSIFKQKNNSDEVAFVIFITDGENCDKYDTDKAIIESSKENIFIQFVGIGNETFKYLQKLDDLSGRKHDNTGFIKVKDFEKISDEEVYTQLLSQYPDWLKSIGL